MADRALVLLSGGLDSATCLYWAKQRFSDVSAISFNYFGRIGREKVAAAKLADAASVSRLIEIDLPFVKEASDFFRHRLKTASDSLASYIPARNMMFYSIAAYHAEFLGVKSIIGGHNKHDVEFFKDASKSYMDNMNALFKQGCLLCDGRTYRITLPLAGKTRKEIVKLALRLKAPIEMTWSCHRDGLLHCGSCYACRQRTEAFRSIGIPDPAFSS
jgi:7-cyano-7-deazaguanine synthase